MRISMFPMTRDMCTVARYLGLMESVSIAGLMVPDFFSIHGNDINIIDGGKETGLILCTPTDSIIFESDIVYIDYDENMQKLSIYNEIIERCNKLGKEIRMTHLLEEKLRLTALDWPTDKPKVKEPDYDRLYEIDIPVISVLTQNKMTDQLSVELGLYKFFSKQGYKVLSFCSSRFGNIFNMCEYPSFLFEHRDAYEKTLMLNLHIYNVVESEKPDILILGVPDPIMKYSNKILNGLGVLPAIICDAVKSDINIACVHKATYNEKFCNELSAFCEYKLGNRVDFIHVANIVTIPNVNSGVDKPKMNYIGLDSDFVVREINKMDVSSYYLFNSKNCASLSKACYKILNMLVGNAIKI